MAELIQEADKTASDMAMARTVGMGAVNDILILDVLGTLHNQSGHTKVEDMKSYVDEVNLQLSRLGFSDIIIEQTRDGHIVAHEKVNGVEKDVDVSQDRVDAFSRLQQAAEREINQGNGDSTFASWSNADNHYKQAAQFYMSAWSRVPAWNDEERARRQQIMNGLDRADLSCRVQGHSMSNIPIRWKIQTSDN